MKKHTIFIDGKAGTTGLSLFERLKKREDIELLSIPEELRKDSSARAERINDADVTFLCLPDAAAREAVSLVRSDKVKLIDASTAHRVSPGWAYGLSELSSKHYEAIARSTRIANPGCHATGFITAVYPLIESGVLDKNSLICCHSITGYSGGGKGMITQYESESRDASLSSPRQYALTQTHKHLSEMMSITGLYNPPVFCPIVADFYCGMAVSIPLFSRMLNKSISLDSLKEIYIKHYENASLISVAEECDGFMPANTLANTDKLMICINGNDDRMTVTAFFDNLGKGAAGAAVQNMNIALGIDETKGLLKGE